MQWLADGIDVAMRSGDPEGLVAQLSDVRRQSLAALGHELDDLERQADEFIAQWRDPRRPHPSWSELASGADKWLAAPEVGEEPRIGGADVAVAVAWFPAGEYEKAIERWESLAEDWAGVAHADYCRRMDGHAKWMWAHGVQVRAVAPIAVDEFVEWCEEHDEDSEGARAQYAADRFRLGGGIDWPPGRNESCWCGSGRKYKKCWARPRRPRCMLGPQPERRRTFGSCATRLWPNRC